MKFKNFFPALVFLLVAILMALSTKLGDKSSFYPTMIGKEIPVFSAPLLDGKGILTSAELKNNTIVNLWASWCTACMAEHEVLKNLAKSHKIYGIDSGDIDAAAREHLRRHGNPFYKVGVDPQRRIALAMGSQGLPETYIIGKNGVVYFHHRGVLTQEIVDKELLPILEQLEITK